MHYSGDNMNWIDDRLQQCNETWARSAQIEQAAEKIFNNIWDAITPLVEEAKTKGIKALTNGHPYERTVVLSVGAPLIRSSGNPRIMVMKLEKDKHCILVSGMQPNIQLDMDVCDDGVVCVKINGKRFSIGDASVYILDRFFFPDLAPLG